MAEQSVHARAGTVLHLYCTLPLLQVALTGGTVSIVHGSSADRCGTPSITAACEWHTHMTHTCASMPRLFRVQSICCTCIQCCTASRGGGPRPAHRIRSNELCSRTVGGGWCVCGKKATTEQLRISKMCARMHVKPTCTTQACARVPSNHCCWPACRAACGISSGDRISTGTAA